MVNVVLAGGGTAGHTSPLIATAQQLVGMAQVEQVSCIGTPKGLEGRVIPDAGLQIDMIPPVPLPRKFSVDLVKVPARLVGAVRRASEVLEARGADVVVADSTAAPWPDVREQLETAISTSAGAPHLVPLPLDGIAEALATSPVPLTSMGRSATEDVTPFVTAALAGRHAAALLP